LNQRHVDIPWNPDAARHRRLHAARRDRVDADRRMHIFHRERPREMNQARLAGGIGRQIGFSDECGRRRDIDDRAASLDQVRERRSTEKERRAQIHRDSSIPKGVLHLRGVAEVDHARHVAERIEPATGLDSRVDRTGACGCVGQIGDVDVADRPHLLKQVSGFLQPSRVDVDQHDLRTGAP